MDCIEQLRCLSETGLYCDGVAGVSVEPNNPNNNKKLVNVKIDNQIIRMDTDDLEKLIFEKFQNTDHLGKLDKYTQCSFDEYTDYNIILYPKNFSLDNELFFIEDSNKVLYITPNACFMGKDKDLLNDLYNDYLNVVDSLTEERNYKLKVLDHDKLLEFYNMLYMGKIKDYYDKYNDKCLLLDNMIITITKESDGNYLSSIDFDKFLSEISKDKIDRYVYNYCNLNLLKIKLSERSIEAFIINNVLVVKFSMSNNVNIKVAYDSNRLTMYQELGMFKKVYNGL